jgi:hypothetical protein
MGRVTRRIAPAAETMRGGYALWARIARARARRYVASLTTAEPQALPNTGLWHSRGRIFTSDEVIDEPLSAVMKHRSATNSSALKIGDAKQLLTGLEISSRPGTSKAIHAPEKLNERSNRTERC